MKWNDTYTPSRSTNITQTSQTPTHLFSFFLFGRGERTDGVTGYSKNRFRRKAFSLPQQLPSIASHLTAQRLGFRLDASPG